MSGTYSTPGIILNYRPVREADRIYSVLTPRRGKVEMLARGSRKITSKLSGELEPAALLKIDAVNGRICDHIVGAERVTSFPILYSDANTRGLALMLLGYIDACVQPNQPDRLLFPLVHELLQIIDRVQSSDGRRFLRDAFAWKSAVVFGLSPDMNLCVGECGGTRSEDFQNFSPSAGGFLCGSCTHPDDVTRLSADSIRFLRSAVSEPLATCLFPSLTFEEAEKIHQLTAQFMLYHLSSSVNVRLLQRLFGDVRLPMVAPLAT